MDNYRDARGIDELAGLEANQQQIVVGGPLNRIHKLMGYGQVEFALDLNFPPVRLVSLLNEAKD